MSLESPRLMHLPIVNTDEKLHECIDEQTQNKIPAFIVRSLRRNRTTTTRLFKAVASKHDWTMLERKPMTHAVGFHDSDDRSRQLERLGLDARASHTGDLGWHRDFGADSDKRMSLLHHTLLGKCTFRAMRVIAPHDALFTKGGLLQVGFTESLDSLKDSDKVNTEYFEPTMWFARLGVGDSLSFTIEGRGQLAHCFTTTSTKRLSAVNDFFLPE